MKKITLRALFMLIIGSGILMQTGCIGSFTLTNKVYDFNKNVGNKFINEVVFLALVIVPVYEITFFVDAVVLNLIEFWTNSNPLGMNEGDIQEKIVKIQSEEYKLTATKNQLVVTNLTSESQDNSFTLNYNDYEESWTMNYANQTYNVLDINSAEELVTVYNADNSTSTFNFSDFSMEQVFAIAQKNQQTLALQ
ncbi:MAG TPA: DUF3332 domain-containing protein [Bacteroidales bacterium]|nr:DUF3332 domain-containing protein [Bacteroidales bacterium]